MIFVVLGTQKFQFNRLLKRVDELIETGIIDEEVVAQAGNSDYKPRNYESFAILNKEKFQYYIDSCDVLVCHGGVGTIISAIKAGKKVVACPRLKRFGEHVDDHQLEITSAFEKRNLLLCCEDDSRLGETINEARNRTFDKYVSSEDKIVELISDFLFNEN